MKLKIFGKHGLTSKNFQILAKTNKQMNKNKEKKSKTEQSDVRMEKKNNTLVTVH